MVSLQCLKQWSLTENIVCNNMVMAKFVEFSHVPIRKLDFLTFAQIQQNGSI